jgi:hypothetical protein
VRAESAGTWCASGWRQVEIRCSAWCAIGFSGFVEGRDADEHAQNASDRMGAIEIWTRVRESCDMWAVTRNDATGRSYAQLENENGIPHA